MPLLHMGGHWCRVARLAFHTQGDQRLEKHPGSIPASLCFLLYLTAFQIPSLSLSLSRFHMLSHFQSFSQKCRCKSVPTQGIFKKISFRCTFCWMKTHSLAWALEIVIRQGFVASKAFHQYVKVQCSCQGSVGAELAEVPSKGLLPVNHWTYSMQKSFDHFSFTCIMLQVLRSC